MKKILLIVGVLLLIGATALYFFTDVPEKVKLDTKSKADLKEEGYNAISEEFLNAAIKGVDTQKHLELISAVSEDELDQQLNSDAQHKAFWINVYNAYILVLLKKNPDLYKDRSAFFEAEQVYVAGNQVSVEEIEHGIPRRSKTKWSLGYISNLFPSDFVKKFRVDDLDYRIHFALNCGAKSCPPVAVYDPDKIDSQLDEVSQLYLSKECKYNEAEDTIGVPAIMSWFRADFDGKNGILDILRHYNIIPESADSEVEFNDYDWTLDLDNNVTMASNK